MFISIAVLVTSAAIALFVLLLVADALTVIPATSVGVVERLGRHNRSLQPGLAVVLPIIDRVHKVDLRNQAIDVSTTLPLNDGLRLTADAVVHVQVVDPVAATYQVADVKDAIRQLTTITLRNLVADQDWSEVRRDHRNHTHELQAALVEACAPWGVRVDGAEIRDISADRL